MRVSCSAIFCAKALGATLPLGTYFNRLEPYQYVFGNTLLDESVHELPGVSFSATPVGLEINGSLWTLRLEFLMYLMVLALGLLRLLTMRVAVLLLAFGMACLRFEMLYPLEKWGWFFELLNRGEFVDSLFLSVIIAVIVSAISTVLGTMAAIAPPARRGRASS